jgi:hypothetical protein
VLIQLFLFLAVIFFGAFWTTMLEPPPPRDEIDEHFEGRSWKGMYYGDRRAKVFIWSLVATVSLLALFLRS